MKHDVFEHYENIPFFLTISIYLIELYLFLFDYISGGAFSLSLFLTFLLLQIILIRVKKARIETTIKRPLRVSILLILLLWFYEMPLPQGDELYYFVTRYNQPEEFLEGSNIFILSVRVDHVGYVENGNTLRDMYVKDAIRFYRIIPATNQVIYRGKNNSFFKEIGIKKDETEEMAENVRAFLKTNNAEMDDFFSQEKLSGSSAGLAIVLASFVDQGKVDNDVPISITGAISKTGKVKKVSYISEKLQIANESGFSYIILPEGNVQEAEDVKKTLQLPIEIFGVSDVDEALEIMEELNNR